MNCLHSNINRKILIILNKIPVHRSNPFFKWLERIKNKIEIFYLPFYSSEFNPDERLNTNSKTHFYSNKIYKSKKEFNSKIINLFRSIQKKQIELKIVLILKIQNMLYNINKL